MLRLKLNHVSKRGHSWHISQTVSIIELQWSWIMSSYKQEDITEENICDYKVTQHYAEKKMLRTHSIKHDLIYHNLDDILSHIWFPLHTYL